MRNGQNKRMRGRNRNKSHHGGGGGGGGGHHHHNPLTRVYESNGPEVKIRGTAHHVAEKYLQLARDATASGDPVTAENHFQHAEHYLRLIAAAQEQFRQQNPYYQAPPAPGEPGRDEVTEEGDDDSGQMPQAQPNFQQSYPPREQPQPYGGPQHQPYQQGRPQHQPQQYQQPPNQPAQHYQQPQRQPEAPPPDIQVSDGERLPSFITGSGSQPQQNPAGFNQNGFDNDSNNNNNNNQGGDRYPRHRRRRHRGPRPEGSNTPQDFRGDDGPDDSRPGNS